MTRFVLLLPVFAALLYALTQLMTRKLSARASASALAVYIQLTFLVVSTGFFSSWQAMVDYCPRGRERR